MGITIILYNNGVFYPEGVIEGKVVCVFNSKEDIRGIRLKLRGREHTSWEEQESYYDDQEKSTKWRTVHFSGDNKFVQMQQTLYGSGTIYPGKYEYPFKFILTSNIPSSYTGAHGHIRYYLKANVDIPMAPDYEVEQQFGVFSPINFNNMLNQIELNPTQYQDETNLCCCCCASDPITMEVYLNKEAFVLGETIQVRIHITNMSNTCIDELTVKLKRFMKEKVTHPRYNYKEEEDDLLKQMETGVGAHGDRDYNFELRLPENLELPNFACSELFSQWFKLKITASVEGCHSNMEMETDVHLGHIPASGYGTAPNLPSQGNTVYPPPYPPGDHAPPYPGVPAQSGTIGFAVPGGNPTGAPPYPIASPSGDFSGAHAPNGFQTSYPPFVAGAPYPPGGSRVGVADSTVGRTLPYPTAPNAPSDESAPSAPTKSDLANSDFIIIDDSPGPGPNDPPPPSYSDATKPTK